MSPQAVIGLNWAELVNLALASSYLWLARMPRLPCQPSQGSHEPSTDNLLAWRRIRLPEFFTKIKSSHIEQQLSPGDLVMPNEAFSPTPSKFGKQFGLLSIKDSSLAGRVLAALCGTVNN
ncbi:hypothetical protein B0H14DRAFT_2614956 [Mycena olivaceomarginata]|nr:hypothetical protein B0H14DRAFT_2614956 [Mycena olivaceomarginata]